MLFGKSSQPQAQAPAGASGAPQGTPAAGYGAEGTGYTQPAGQASPWTGVGGYPTQPAGTGYAGYTPGTQQSAGNYAQAGQTGYGATAYGGYGQPAAGYGQTGQGYAQPQQGYAAPQAAYGQPQGYGQAAQGYAQPQSGYAQGQGAQAYGQPQTGYTYPQMNGNGYGAQNGYTQGQPYAAGYNAPYAQMGRNQPQPQGQPQDYSRQIPLNGGGYVPPAVPVKKQPFVFKGWMLIALGVVLAVLFAVGLIVRLKALLWVFAVLAAASVVFFWVRPLISGNRRLCYTIIFGVLSVLAIVVALGVLDSPADNTRTPGATVAETAQPADSAAGAGGTVIDPETGSVISAVEQAAQTPTPTPVVEDNSTMERLESFFRYWSANRQDEMLTLCAPSWQSSVDNPKTALFGLMANRTPLDYTPEKISGTADDTSRTVTVVSTMDRNNGKDPVKYRLSVLMVREGDQWYVDPQSLKTYEEADTPDPSITDTPAPTEEPLVNAGTVLYYNPDGGSKYHLDPNCKSTHAKFLPFKGHFTYAEVNDEKYKDLSPCNVCGAPLRP